MATVTRTGYSYCLMNWCRHVFQQRVSAPTQCRSLASSNALRDRQGTKFEIAEERRRKNYEMRLYEELAEHVKAKDKKTFMQAIQIYERKQSVHKRGNVEFVTGSLDKMKEFNVHKDLEVYKALMEVFPAGKMVPRNLFQSEFMHFPRQQDAALQVLNAMSHQGCIPDDKMGDIIVARFGKTSYVMKCYQRMMYWMPKFRSINPYPIPWELPNRLDELAVLALKRMAIDIRNEVTVHYTQDTHSTNEETFIASAISPEQQGLIEKHNSSLPLFVEGGFSVWLRDRQLIYFILRADPRPEVLEYNRPVKEHQEIEVFSTFIGADDEEKREKTALLADPSKHEQPEGTILAMCITGTSSKDSLLAWINCLQETNPSLSKSPIIFSLRTPESGVVPHQEIRDPSELESGVQS